MKGSVASQRDKAFNHGQNDFFFAKIRRRRIDSEARLSTEKSNSKTRQAMPEFFISEESGVERSGKDFKQDKNK
jgi:hypothetical protein